MKELRPGGFTLWVFQRNTGARRFYERRGLRLVELTDGAGNDEREPDASTVAARRLVPSRGRAWPKAGLEAEDRLRVELRDARLGHAEHLADLRRVSSS